MEQITLGCLAKDTISGFEGIVISKTEWLNGCVRIQIQPRTLHDGKPIDAQVFDQQQVERLGNGILEASAEPVAPIRKVGGDRPTVSRASDPK